MKVKVLKGFILLISEIGKLVFELLSPMSKCKEM